MSAGSWPEFPIKLLVDLNPEVLPENFPIDEQIYYVEISDVSESRGIHLRDAIRFGDAPSRARRPFRNGDVLISTVRTYLRAVAGAVEMPERSVASTGFAVLRPRKVHSRFLMYAMLNSRFLDEVVARSVGVSYPAINSSDLVAIKIQVPSPTMQAAVAGFLDRETAEIAAFIADQEKLVELLAERRRAAQAQVMSKVDGAPKVRMRFLFEQSREDDSSDSDVLSVYRDFGVIPKASRSDNFNKTPEDVSRYLVVRPGYLVVNKMKAWQGSLGVSAYQGIVSPDYEVLRPSSDRLIGEFAHEYLRSPRMVAEYAVNSVGIRPSQWRLYWDQFRDISLPVPPTATQQAILNELQLETSEIDSAISDARVAIGLSRERRAALISAAVTGKVDVREHGVVA